MKQIRVSEGGVARSWGRNFCWASLVALIVFPLVIGLLLLGFISVVWGDVQTVGDVFWLVATETVAIAAGACAARFAIRCTKASVVISGDQIVVVNPWRTYRADLDAIAGFEGKPVNVGFGNPVPGVVARLTDGTEYFVWTLANECLIWNVSKHAQRWDEVAKTLNARVESLRSSY